MKQRVVYFVLLCLFGWTCLFLFLTQKADAFQMEDAVVFEEQLAADDLIGYFKLRKQIEALTFDDLETLSEELEPGQNCPFLEEILHKVIDERMDEGIFLLPEDIHLNNVPRMIDEPFYAETRTHLINDLNVESEYLHFPNQRYHYQKNALVKKDPLWLIFPEIEADADNNGSDEGVRSISKVSFIQEEHLKKNPLSWTRALSLNRLTNYTNTRQWIKKYQEPQPSVVLNNDTLILRDHYRLYGLDKSSGLQRWSFALPDDSKQEYYQTLYPPHLNEESYEIERVRDKIFAEINHSLIALETKTRSLIWQYPLGAFTLCTKPVKAVVSLEKSFDKEQYDV